MKTENIPPLMPPLATAKVPSVSDNAVTGEKFQEGVAKNIEIDIALEGCAILQQMDAVKGGSPYWHPGIGL